MADKETIDEHHTAPAIKADCYSEGPSILPLANIEGIGGMAVEGENWEVEVRSRKTSWASRMGS